MSKVLKFMMLFFPLLMSIAMLTLVESKVLGYTQISKGPNIVGLYGLLQPLADGVKLFLKEPLIPNHVNMFIFMLSPLLMFMLAMMVWFFMPFNMNSYMFKSNMSMLMMLAINSMSVFAIMMAGWGSNSKYGFMGSVSATSQMISYEVSLGLIIMNLSMLCYSLDLVKVYFYQEACVSLVLPLIPMFFLFFMSLMAETNSAPFDLAESESELVSGYNIEYAGFMFALFFLGEYSHMMFSSYLMCVLFTSNTFLSLSFKSLLIMFVFMWMSSSFPSFSYDHLMHLLWKSYLPLSILYFMLCAMMYMLM